MKKLFIFLIIGILLVGTFGIFLLRDEGVQTISKTKEYSPKLDQIKIKVNDNPKETRATYTLTDNSYQCLTNCHAEGTAELNEKGYLFSWIKFKDVKGKSEDIDYKIFIEKEESYQVRVINESSRRLITGGMFENGTEKFREDYSYKDEERHRNTWVEYDGKELDEGTYKWRIEGTKDINKNIDWIASAFGEDFNEWAWWNSSWSYSRTQNITEYYGVAHTNEPVVFTINASLIWDKIQSDGDDLRIINVTNDNNTELARKVTMNTSVAGNIEINFNWTVGANDNSTQFALYYGNPSAGTGTSMNPAWQSVPLSSTSELVEFHRTTGTDSAHLGDADYTNLYDNAYDGNPGIGGNVWYVGSPVPQFAIIQFNADYIIGKSQAWATCPWPDGLSNNYLLKDYSIAGTLGTNLNKANDYTWLYNRTGSTDSGCTSFNMSFKPTLARQVLFQIDATQLVDGFHAQLAEWEVWAVEPLNIGGLGNETTDTGLIVILLSPEDNASLITRTPNLVLDVSSTATEVKNVTANVYNSSSFLIFSQTNSSGITGEYSFSISLDNDGLYYWNATAYSDINISHSSITRTFTVDTLFPQINISAPQDEQNFPYLVNLDNITLNVTVDESNLDTCWYEYNNTNTTFSCLDGVLSENNLTINNKSTVTVWANDTYGNLNSSQLDWTFTIFDINSYTYDNNITEASQTTITANFQMGSSISSAYLNYNNTNNSVSINSLGGNRYTLSSIVTSPVVNSNVNITWFYWINGINTTQFNQTVINVNLDNCDSYSNIIVAYNLKDELTQEYINNTNSTIESSVILKSLTGDKISQFNQVFTGNQYAKVCSEINLTSSGLRLWEQSRYGSDDYVFEQHNVQNTSLSSVSNFTLLDLPSNSATTFRITYKSSTFLPIPDAVIDIQRKYIGEGAFKSVESPITDTNGEVSVSLDLDSVIYRIVVRENGVVLSTFENPAVACSNILTGDCSINLNEKQTINLINTYDTENDFLYGLTQNNRTITLTFEIPSGTSKTINLFTNQSTIVGNETSCDQTVFASSGQLQCDIENSLGDVFVTATVSVDSAKITSASSTILEDRSTYFGTDNIVLTFFLVLSLALLMVSDPITVLIGIVIGLISGGLMMFLNAGSVFGVTSILMYAIIVVLILIVKISKRQR